MELNTVALINKYQEFGYGCSIPVFMLTFLKESVYILILWYIFKIVRVSCFGRKKANKLKIDL